MPVKKKAAKKRAYVKRSAKWSLKDTKNAIKNIDLVKPAQLKRAYKRKQKLVKVESPLTNRDTELEQLTIICSFMDNLNSEQKQRFLKFLCGRYYDFM